MQILKIVKWKATWVACSDKKRERAVSTSDINGGHRLEWASLHQSFPLYPSGDSSKTFDFEQVPESSQRNLPSTDGKLRHNWKASTEKFGFSSLVTKYTISRSRSGFRTSKKTFHFLLTKKI